MAKAVIVGDRRLAAAFTGVGFESVIVDEPEDLMKVLFQLSRDRELGVVLVAEALAQEAPEALEEFRRRSKAVLSTVPSHEKSLRTGFLATRRLVESSLGIDLLGEGRG
ncbi:MAG TPA: V-type ATP synthase subunit F [Deltaproteobacteria bacterium]|nr:V-type ATP synthase subunit F [Deltaproteobacteria bacterium]